MKPMLIVEVYYACKMCDTKVKRTKDEFCPKCGASLDWRRYKSGYWMSKKRLVELLREKLSGVKDIELLPNKRLR